MLNDFIELIKSSSVGVHLVIKTDSSDLFISRRKHGLSNILRTLSRNELHINLVIDRAKIQIDSI